ncbi:MAG: glycosyl hydrolase, partial [Euryarchaeota archaeon]|nr:glycosyl hydrolase [Euryarchaeota archaeon]
SGYSSLAVGHSQSASAGWIYLFYEHDPFKGSHMTRFNLTWVLQGKVTGNGTLPKLKRD